MDLGLAGKRALVTGGASGLGRALVEVLHAEGAQVAFNYRSRKDEAEQMVTDLGGEGIVALPGDLADREQVATLVPTAIEALGGLDILVNNAGIWLSGYVGEIDDDHWDRTMDVNLRAPVMLCQQFVTYARETDLPWGSILNISSQAGFHGSTTGHSPYAASKAGLSNFTVSLARELGSAPINANSFLIGMMHSPMSADALAARPDYYANRIPRGRPSQPEELAKIAAFLVSPVASYMTGTAVDVTGGMLMR